jgi:hypothetical protein
MVPCQNCAKEWKMRTRTEERSGVGSSILPLSEEEMGRAHYPSSPSIHICLSVKGEEIRHDPQLRDTEYIIGF